MSRGGEGKRRRADADEDENRGRWFAGRYYRSTDGTDYQSRERGMFVVLGVDPGMFYDTHAAASLTSVREDDEQALYPDHHAQQLKRRADAQLIQEFGSASDEELVDLWNGA